MEISTKSQAENGTDNTTIMTPLRVKQSINANASGGGGGTYTAGTGIDITNNVISNEFTKTSDLVNDSNFAVTNANNFFTASQTIIGGDIVADGNYVRNGGDLVLTPEGPMDTPPTNETGDIVFNQWKEESQYGYREVEKARIWVDNALTSASHNPNYRAYDASGNLIVSTHLALVDDITNYHDSSKQDALVSGTNIKTINNQSLLGSGNITIQSGGSNTYYFDGQNNAANLAMINEICGKFDLGQEINFTGRFVDGEYNQMFDAPINITKYSSGTDNAWASFTSDPIPWLDNSTTPAKVRYLAYAFWLQGSWGAYTSVQTYRLDDFIPGSSTVTETDPTVPAAVKAITSSDISNWNGKPNLSGYIPDVNEGASSYVDIGWCRICFGKVAINPTANQPTGVWVTFPAAFVRNPVVIVTPNTAVPYTTVRGCGVSDVSTTGMNVYLTRTNTTKTLVYWYAMGPAW